MGANRVTGASANAITKAIGCRHATAKALLGELVALSIVSKAPQGVPAGRMKQAYWVMEFAGDVAMPQALVHGVSRANGIKARLLDNGGDIEAKSCALVMLAHLYARHDLEKFGGVDPSLIKRPWKMVPRAYRDAFKINGEPVTDAQATEKFMKQLLAMIGITMLDATAKQIFWDAFHMLKDSGLLYEVVTLFDSNRLVVPIRVNDHHAVASEPALLSCEDMNGSGFYDAPDNERGNPEGCYFEYPDDPTHLRLVGIWRLRFRCATLATALGLKRDRHAVATVVQKLVGALS